MRSTGLKPQTVVRFKNGVRIERRQVRPTPFDAKRAEEILEQALADLASPLDEAMTDGEIAYVKHVWHLMPGWTCFADAFHKIRRGDV